MEEIQNAGVEMQSDDELFFDPSDFPEEDGGDQSADQAEEPADEGQEGQPTEDGTTEEGQEQPPEPEDFLEVEFLDEKKSLSKEEAKSWAQKGMNHDRMKQQRDDMRSALQEQLNWRSQNQEHIDDIANLAKASGMNISSFIGAMKENLYVRQGMSRDAAKERVQRDKIQRQLDARTTFEEQKSRKENAQKDRVQREIADFSKRFPNVDVKTIPQEVFQEAASGSVSLAGAYISHLNSQLKAENERLSAEVKAYQQNEKNKMNSVGSAKTGGANAKYDDFLTGFNE